MSFATVVFDLVDVLFDAPQNKRKVCRDKEKAVIIERDIVYDSNRAKQCILDIYKPAQQPGNKLPVIFHIHGGGFVAGDKKHRRGLSTWLVKNAGACVFNVNYGLAPNDKFPQPVKDLVNAFNFMISHAQEYNLDTDKIFVLGDSAGGYYSAMMGALHCSKDLQDKFGVELNGKIHGAILDCGIYDLEQALSAKTLFNISGHIVKDYLGTTIDKIRQYEHCDLLSPINYINEQFPVSFVTYAEQDFFCGGQGELLIKKLQDLGVKCKHYHSVKFSENHTFPLTWNSKGAKENNKLMLEFLLEEIEADIIADTNTAE